MKKLALLSAFVLCLTSAAYADSWKGWISDAHCGADGAKAAHKACAEKCLKGGEKAVFVKDGKVFKLDDKGEKTAHGYLGYEVEVTGSLAGDTITVEKIAKAK